MAVRLVNARFEITSVDHAHFGNGRVLSIAKVYEITDTEKNAFVARVTGLSSIRPAIFGYMHAKGEITWVERTRRIVNGL